VDRLLRSAAVVTAPSRYLQDQMSVFRPDVLLIPNPLELRDYPFVPREHARPLLVWLRAFHAVYNPVLAVRVLAHLRRTNPDCAMVMVGPDKGDGSLGAVREAAERLQVAGHLTLSGPVPKDQVPGWLAKGDVFLNTTNVDNTPVSVLEAMACGLCVVSTNVGGIPYLMTDGADALLVPPDDPSSMAAAVQRVIESPALAARLSHGARAAVEPFDWSKILPTWDALLLGVAAPR
jgi:glycosyltransferase involved in cell wall biosynthesis